jgi:hypothetical protein
MTIISDKEISKSVSKLNDRSERQLDIKLLISTFVDVGIVPQIDNTRNQIIYGRRGTGKTHLMKVLSDNLKEQNNTIPIYLDCRTLGSSELFSDSTASIKLRCLSLFKDIINNLYNPLLEFVAENSSDSDEGNRGFEILDSILDSINRNEEIDSNTKVTTNESYKNSIAEINKLELNAFPSPQASFKLGDEIKDSHETDVKFEKDIIKIDKIFFPEINQKFNQFCNLFKCTIFLLIDEWASIPFEIQPYLAEFLKKSFFANPQVVIKITSLEYRSNFNLHLERNIIGFELGSDISASLDIDDYFVYDRNPGIITKNFAEILFKHISSSLPNEYLKSQFKVNNSDTFIKTFFSDKSTFEQIVRSSEGVVRDLINIFIKAFFSAQRKNMSSIDKKSVIESARQWFESDKSINLDKEMNILLDKIVEEVIGKKRARSFLLERQYENNKLIQKLFDARVLHVVHRGYSDKGGTPGIRYNIYTLDYGTYVDLMNTNKAPDNDFTEAEAIADDFIVPFDDKRSIRRIILNPSLL